jgi:hypothetical protein
MGRETLIDVIKAEKTTISHNVREIATGKEMARGIGARTETEISTHRETEAVMGKGIVRDIGTETEAEIRNDIMKETEVEGAEALVDDKAETEIGRDPTRSAG